MVDLDNGNYEVRFTPTSPGTYCLNIFIFARPIKVVAVVVVVILLLLFFVCKNCFCSPALSTSQSVLTTLPLYHSARLGRERLASYRFHPF